MKLFIVLTTIVVMVLITISVILIFNQPIKSFFKTKFMENVPNEMRNYVKGILNQKIGRDVSHIVDLYSNQLNKCLTVEKFPRRFKNLIEVTMSNDPKLTPCIRNAFNLLVMKYWADELEANTEENLINTMECINKLPLDENTLTRFPLRAAECAGERSWFKPDVFGASSKHSSS